MSAATQASQVVREVLLAGPRRGDVSQLFREVLVSSDSTPVLGTPTVLVSQVIREVLLTGPPFLNLSQITREVLVSENDTPVPGTPTVLHSGLYREILVSEAVAPPVTGGRNVFVVIMG